VVAFHNGFGGDAGPVSQHHFALCFFLPLMGFMMFIRVMILAIMEIRDRRSARK
jgi:hypothetical protein